MKSRIGLLIRLGFVFVSCVAISARANEIQVGYSGYPYGIYQAGSGGEFTVLPVNPSGWINLSDDYSVSAKTMDVGVRGSFQTFCLEEAESIQGYPHVFDAVLNLSAVNGGVGPGGDPISVGTGWIYSEFVKGALSGYDYSTTTSARKFDADLLQRTIWWLEGEGESFDSANAYMNLVISHFGTDSAAMKDGGWIYGVYALNMTSANGGLRQDVLVKVPDSGLTIALLGIAMGFVGMVSRRMVK